MYYSYHAKIKNKIKLGILKYFYFTKDYKKIGQAMILVFSDGSQFPIRQHRYFEYLDLIEQLYNINNANNKYITNKMET